MCVFCLLRTSLWEKTKHYSLMMSETRPFKILIVIIFSLSPLQDKIQWNKVQWLDLASHLWPTLIGLPLASGVNIHYEIIIKYSKSHLNSSSTNYAWFMQYKESDNGDGRVISLPLGMHYEP